MLRNLLTLFSLILTFQNPLLAIDTIPISKNLPIVTATKRIYLPDYPGAYNPSIVKYKEGYLLTFRYLPNRSSQPWNSHIGAVLLNESFEPVSNSEILDTRFNLKEIPSQSEDARIFSFEGRLYIIYNDNVELTFPSVRRDIYIAELIHDQHRFQVAEPLKLFHEEKHQNVMWQKNWSPFVWNGSLLFSYSINPHEVISPNLKTGSCRSYLETAKSLHWEFGPIHGGTPAELIDGEYLAFFHSRCIACSNCSDNKQMWHYVMGAYTFSAEPPFEVTKMSVAPIDASGFYTYSSYDKRVIYPGGFVVSDSKIYLAYGKDDSELWIATIDLTALKTSLVSIQP